MKERLALFGMLFTFVLLGFQMINVAGASPVDTAIMVHGAVPDQHACEPVEMVYRVSATDGGVKGIMVDAGASGVSYAGATFLAGAKVSSVCGDGITIRNNSAVPLRCRAVNSAAAGTTGFTVCNHTGCDFANSIMHGPYNPCKIVCNIPAINRDAGILTFTGTIERGCL